MPSFILISDTSSVTFKNNFNLILVNILSFDITLTESILSIFLFEASSLLSDNSIALFITSSSVYISSIIFNSYCFSLIKLIGNRLL